MREILLLCVCVLFVGSGAGCSKDGANQKSGDSAVSASKSGVKKPSRKRFVLEGGTFKVEVSIPAAEAEYGAGTYLARVRDTAGRPRTLVGERSGVLEDAWLTDLGKDGDLQLLVWIDSDSAHVSSRIDCYDYANGEWTGRQIPLLDGDWAYEVKRGILFAEARDPEVSGGHTYSVPTNRWEAGLPTFE